MSWRRPPTFMPGMPSCQPRTSPLSGNSIDCAGWRSGMGSFSFPTPGRTGGWRWRWTASSTCPARSHTRSSPTPPWCRTCQINSARCCSATHIRTPPESVLSRSRARPGDPWQGLTPCPYISPSAWFLLSGTLACGDPACNPGVNIRAGPRHGLARDADGRRELAMGDKFVEG